MKEYRLNREDYIDREWFNLISFVEKIHIQYCDIFDSDGEVCEDYSDLFNTNIYVLPHDMVRISELETLQNFFMYEMIDTILAEEIIDFIETSEGRSFQVSGDGDGIGFVVDIFSDEEAENIIQSVWFN